MVLGTRVELHPHRPGHGRPRSMTSRRRSQILQDTPLATGAWVRGTQPLNYTASDNVGVRARASLSSADATADIHDRACVTRCPTGPFAAPVAVPERPGPDRRSNRSSSPRERSSSSSRPGRGGEPSALGPGRRHGSTTRLRHASRWRRGRRGVAQPKRLGGGLDEPRRSRPRADRRGRTTSYATRGARVCSRGTQAGPDVSRLPMTVPGPGEWTLSLWRRTRRATKRRTTLRARDPALRPGASAAGVRAAGRG